MQKRSWVFVAFSFITGAFAMFLRWLQLLNCFEEDTGLFVSGSPITVLLIVMAAAAAFGLLLLSLSAKRAGLPADLAQALRIRSFIPLALTVLGCLVMLVGAVILMFTAGSTGSPMLYRLLALLGIASAPALFTLVRKAESSKADGVACLCGVTLCAFYCFWLIVSYKDHASDPVVWDYAPEILALSASLLAVYYLAGYVFGKPKPPFALFFCGLSFVLCLLTTPDSRGAAQGLMLMAPAAVLLLTAWVLLSNTGRNKRPAHRTRRVTPRARKVTRDE